MAFSGAPIFNVALCFGLAFVATLLIEPFAVPRRAAIKAGSTRNGRDLPVRLLFITLIFLAFFAISWRPIYTFAATLSFFAIFTAISRAKYEFIREPLVFADVALLPLLVRHKDLFHAGYVGIAFWLLSFGYVFGASALFYYFEPSQAPSAAWIAAVAVAAVLPWTIIFAPPLRSRIAGWAMDVLGAGDPIRSTRRLGTFAYVILHFLAWLGFRRRTSVGRKSAEVRAMTSALEKAGEGAPVVIVWQSESFYDMRRASPSPLALPTIDRLRSRASRWGLISNIFEGGYTLRTEFSVIAGISPATLGPDAYYPYLNPEVYAPAAWPVAFRQAGWRTTFIHPYDRYFFRRHEAMPALGFEEVTMLDAFGDGSGDGLYVSDAELARRVVDLCTTDRDKPQFVFVATMENHGPWKPGRLGSLTDPLQIYQGLLERTDQALSGLIETLDACGRPVWFVFYGDHAPLLEAFPDGLPDPRTDYIIVPVGTAATSPPGGRIDTDPWRLIEDMVAAARSNAAS